MGDPAESTEKVGVEQVRADLCIMGAGIAGLNVLAVAARHLTSGQKVVLIDRNPRPGGMWNNTYDYVRLHQPHPMFTAGNVRWKLDQPPSYLPTKGEVLDHFEHCVEQARTQVQVETRLGWEVEGHEEVDGRVLVRATGPDGGSLVVDAARFVLASGLDVRPNEPLTLSSERVRSVSPDSWDPHGPEVAADDAPVWIIGGGKTAMDTAHALLRTSPRREVNLVTGSGTFFGDREKLFPSGRRRWTAPRSNAVFTQVARRFDGTNEVEVSTWLMNNFGTWLSPGPTNFMLGLLSATENAEISRGVREVVPDHLVDVVDRADATELVLKGGGSRPVAPGSWIVNCTGYLLKHPHEPQPLISPSGNVMSVTTRSAVFHLTSFQAYFTTHLFLDGRLGSLPLYQLDIERLQQQHKRAIGPTLVCLTFHNLSVVSEAGPASVFLECGLDFDRWFPAPRRALGTASFLRTHKRDRDHHRQALDVVRERFDLAGGVHQGQLAQRWLRTSHSTG